MTETPSTATGPTASPEAAETPAATEVDYNALLDQIPDDVLTRHRRFNGIVGSHAQRLAEHERIRIKEEERIAAETAERERLRKLAAENPFQFSQEWLGDEARKTAELELSQLRTKTQQALFERIAQSYSALPEWQNLTPDEFAKVQQQVAGKSDDELVAAFNVAALDVLAERRATSRAERAVKDRLAAERAAWEQEMQARRLRGEPVPDMSAPVSANGVNDAQAIRGMSDAEFNAFYERNIRR